MILILCNFRATEPLNYRNTENISQINLKALTSTIINSSYCKNFELYLSKKLKSLNRFRNPSVLSRDLKSHSRNSIVIEEYKLCTSWKYVRGVEARIIRGVEARIMRGKVSQSLVYRQGKG